MPLPKRALFTRGLPKLALKTTFAAVTRCAFHWKILGAAPLVEPVGVGRVQLCDLGAISLSSDEDFENFKARAAQVSNSEDSILRARIAGHVAPKVARALDDWLANLREEWLGVDVDVSRLFAQPTPDDFRALRLERLEESLLESLSGPLSGEYLSGVRGAAEIASWSADEAARREALALYYRLLGEAR
jgi:hypothetical protein